MNHKGQYQFSPSKDLPLLQLICDATYITRPQIEILIADLTDELNSDSRNRRLKRLVTLKQIKIYPQCFPYSGRVFAVTKPGMDTLHLAGCGIPGASTDSDVSLDLTRIPHFIGLNEIEIAARKNAFNVRRWIGNRQLIASNSPVQKGYDSIAEITWPADSNAVMRLGIAYKLTAASKDQYEQIRENLKADRQIHRMLYFVHGAADANFVAQHLYSETVPVGVVSLGHFQRMGVAAPTRLVRNWSVIETTLRDHLTRVEAINEPEKESSKRKPT